MMDLIERAAAQTELMMKCERYTLARESHGMGHVEWSSDLISVADAMDAIRDLPSAQPEPQWIPVSERLPEYGKPVLWSNECGSVFTSAITVMNDHSWAIGKRHRLTEVTAWMPLPEPYRAERRTDE